MNVLQILCMSLRLNLMFHINDQLLLCPIHSPSYMYTTFVLIDSNMFNLTGCSFTDVGVHHHQGHAANGQTETKNQSSVPWRKNPLYTNQAISMRTSETFNIYKRCKYVALSCRQPPSPPPPLPSSAR